MFEAKRVRAGVVEHNHVEMGMELEILKVDFSDTLHCSAVVEVL